MTDDQILEVVAAHKEGKKIQTRPLSRKYDWYGVGAFGIRWNFETHEFRVAPEPPKPREWKIGINGSLMWVIQDDSGKYQALEVVRVREVIEADRDVEFWYAELPIDERPGQIFTDSRQLTKGGKLVKVQVIE